MKIIVAGGVLLASHEDEGRGGDCWKQFNFNNKNNRLISTINIDTPTHGEIFSESCLSKSNLDCNYTFPIDLAPVEMCQFTSIPITRFKVSFMLQNFSQCR